MTDLPWNSSLQANAGCAITKTSGYTQISAPGQVERSREKCKEKPSDLLRQISMAGGISQLAQFGTLRGGEEAWQVSTVGWPRSVDIHIEYGFGPSLCDSQDGEHMVKFTRSQAGVEKRDGYYWKIIFHRSCVSASCKQRRWSYFILDYYSKDVYRTNSQYCVSL